MIQRFRNSAKKDLCRMPVLNQQTLPFMDTYQKSPARTPKVPTGEKKHNFCKIIPNARSIRRARPARGR